MHGKIITVCPKCGKRNEFAGVPKYATYSEECQSCGHIYEGKWGLGILNMLFKEDGIVIL